MKDIFPLSRNGRGWYWLGLILFMWMVSAGFSGCGPEGRDETVHFDVEEGYKPDASVTDLPGT